MIGRIWREPLIHFLAGGGLLFAIYHFNGDPGPREIVVDQTRLLTYLQHKTRIVPHEVLATQLQDMSATEFDMLVRAYVDEEMLYREAQSYMLDKGDEVIRQRLIQRARLLLDQVQAEAPPTDEELWRYYSAHKDRFISPATVTFTHVFFDSAVHGSNAEQMARDARQMLNSKRAQFGDAAAHGDRFPYLINYVDRSEDFVASQLGVGMSSLLILLEPSETEWRGPYRSAFGWHVVLLVRKRDARQLGFEEVRNDVNEAFVEERSLRARREVLDSLRSKYEVRMEVQRDASLQPG